MPEVPAIAQSNPKPLDAAAVLAWYDRAARSLPWRVPPSARRRGVQPDPYRVWLSEVMLQQTTVGTVGGYFVRFTALWPTVADLAAAPLDDVLAQWAGLGYYARARNLHACAQAVAARYGGAFPRTAAELGSLPGIGPYTGAAIAAICFDERVPVLDGNVERVLARFLALPKPPREAKEMLRRFLAGAVPARAGDFAQALMDLGATVCTPRQTLCLVCPLSSACTARALGRQLEFPVRAAKPERPTRFGHAFVLVDRQGAVWLRKRPETGLLGGMTETPGSPWTDRASEPDFPAAGSWVRRPDVVHVFTHFRLELAVWHALVERDEIPGEGWWCPAAALGAQALPTLFRKVLGAAGIG